MYSLPYPVQLGVLYAWKKPVTVRHYYCDLHQQSGLLSVLLTLAWNVLLIPNSLVFVAFPLLLFWDYSPWSSQEPPHCNASWSQPTPVRLFSNVNQPFGLYTALSAPLELVFFELRNLSTLGDECVAMSFVAGAIFLVGSCGQIQRFKVVF